LDPIITLLTTALGAVAGTAVGLLILYRRLRPPITDGELAELKARLRVGESSLAAATSNLEDLRKQLAFQERTILQNGADLQKRQEQLDLQSAETQKERTLRSAAEKSLEELNAKMSLLRKECTTLEGQVLEESNLAGERGARLASIEPELEAARNKVKELSEQAAALTAETAGCKRISEQEAQSRKAADTELAAARTRIAVLTEDAARLTREATESQSAAARETRLRTALETELNADRERLLQLTAEIAELHSERQQLEIKLQEERGSAAKGVELLKGAQEKLASVFKALATEAPNGLQVNEASGVISESLEPKSEAEELARTA